MLNGKYTYRMRIPVCIGYSKGEDGELSIDTVNIPTEDEIYSLVNKHAKEIKEDAANIQL